MLRRVGRGTTTGVPRIFAQYLERRMTGSAPLDHLPKMYEALELYAGPFDFTGPLLQEAIDAVEFGEAQELKALMVQILEQVDDYMRGLASRLYEHDGQGEAGDGPDNPPTSELLSHENMGDLTDDSNEDGPMDEGKYSSMGEGEYSAMDDGED
ncbi:hypothetical protein ACJ41O_009324 [Fusarium nematophilum]